MWTMSVSWVHKGSADVSYTDVTRHWDLYAVQDPRARELVNALVEAPVDDLKFFAIMGNTIGGIPVKINRSGFTGKKWGYEIYLAPDKGDTLEDKFRQAGAPLNAREVTDFQIMAISLPTVAGFYYMRDLMCTNPFEVGLDRGIGWGKDFIGKEALLKIRETGWEQEMVGLTVAQDDVHIQHKGFGGPGDAVLLDGEEVGRVSKFTYSFVKEINIGYILAKKGTLTPGTKVQIHGCEATITPAPKFL